VITKLNLATRPFRNRTLPYLATALLLMISAVIGVYCLATLKQNKDRNDLLVKAVQERQAEIARLKGEGEKVQQLLTPEQKELLTASHKLIANKAFGWSRLFADLEGVLPASVSASRITVDNIYQDGDRIKAELEFSVLSKDYPAVMAMIDNMNNSGLFRAELRGQDLEKNERITYTEYTFRLIYTPSYGYASRPSSDVAMNEQGGGQ
jgi:Tfp pilus assembly protein PilN